MTTTLPASSQSRIVKKARLKLTESGDIEGTLEITFSGLEALQRRVEERNLDETAQRKFLEDEARDDIPAGAEVELTNKPEWNSSAPMFVADYKIKITGWTTSAGRRSLLAVGLFSAQEKRLFDHADRVHPIYFEYPFEQLDEVDLEVPTGWQIDSVPRPQQTGGQVVAYALKVDKDNNHLRLSRELSVNCLLLEAKYYPALRIFFQTVRKDDELQVVLVPAASAAAN